MLLRNKRNLQKRNIQREGGNTSEFQELQNAYRRIIKYIEDKQKKEEFEVDDDDYETWFFMKHNMVKECSTSHMIYIQEEFVDRWKKVLENHLSIHKSDKGRLILKTGDITVTLYIKPKKDPRSKLHLQSRDQQKNFEFIMEKLSMFYHEVYATNRDALSAIELKNLQRAICDICGKHFTNKKGVKKHFLRMLEGKEMRVANNKSKSNDHTPITIEENVHQELSPKESCVPGSTIQSARIITVPVSRLQQ